MNSGEWLLISAAAVSWAGALVWFDLRYRRLPNWLTLPAAAGVAVVLLAAGHPAALTGALAWAGLYLAVGWLNGGVGGGDVKLALALGPACWWAAGPLGVAGAIVGSSAVSLAAAACRRDTRVPHGPGMLLAAGVVLALTLPPAGAVNLNAVRDWADPPLVRYWGNVSMDHLWGIPRAGADRTG